MPSIIAFWGVICYLPPFRGTRNGFGVSFLMKMFREYVVEYFSSSRFGSCNLFICLLWDLLQPESFRESWEIKSLSNIIPARFRSKQNANHRQPFTTPTAGFLGGKQKKKRTGEKVKPHPPTQKAKPNHQKLLEAPGAGFWTAPEQHHQTSLSAKDLQAQPNLLRSDH